MMTGVDDQARVHERYRAELVHHARMLIGSADADDLVTDVITTTTASASWLDVRHERAYLHRALVSAAASWGRSEQRRRRRERAIARPDESLDPENAVDAIRAVAGLSTQQRSVIYLTYWEDRTPADIAQLLDISDGTVRKQLARAREHLRKALA
jgi:RNA polymerase sigma factor (sigma-70 family)